MLVVIQDDARFVLIAFIHRRVSKQDAQNIDVGVIGNFHGWLQYLDRLLVLYAVTTTGGCFDSLTIARTKYALPFIVTRDW